MSRYIDAEKLIKDGWSLQRTKHSPTSSTYEVMELDCVPTADVRENVKGEWIKQDRKAEQGFQIPIKKCSICGEAIAYSYEYNFCPNCGADMRGEA